MKIGLYVDGEDQCACSVCGASFIGDKRAVHCLACAAKGLLARYERLEVKLEPHRWIPLAEGPPKTNGVGVIVCDANYEGVGECWCCCYDSGKFMMDGRDMTDRVTHWKLQIMP